MESNWHLIRNLFSRSSHQKVLSILLLAALTSCGKPQETIAFFNEDVGARSEKVVACLEGIEPANSEGCVNANLSANADKQLVLRVANFAAAKRDMPKGDKEVEKSADSVAAAMVDELQFGFRMVNCIVLNQGKPQPSVQGVIKVAIDEKMIQPMKDNPLNFEVTKKGAQYLKSQIDSMDNFFCPLNFNYKDNVKMLERRDLTEQYKGRLLFKSYKIEALEVDKIAFDIENTRGSVWFQKKTGRKTIFPLEAKAVFEVYFITYWDKDKLQKIYGGWYGTLDGKPFVYDDKSNKNVDELLATFVTKD